MRDFSTYPSAADYLAFAEEAGCECARSAAGTAGEALTLARLTRGPDHEALLTYGEVDERLMSTTVAALDRRLGLKSAFFH